MPCLPLHLSARGRASRSDGIDSNGGLVPGRIARANVRPPPQLGPPFAESGEPVHASGSWAAVMSDRSAPARGRVLRARALRSAARNIILSTLRSDNSPRPGAERRLRDMGDVVVRHPNNDRLFYLCPRCEAGGVNWCGMKDLQGRKLYVCEKDERHITTLERLREASRKRRLLD